MPARVMQNGKDLSASVSKDAIWSGGVYGTQKECIPL